MMALISNMAVSGDIWGLNVMTISRSKCMYEVKYE